MAISGITQPEIIEIDEQLRLRKYSNDCAFALAWYQDVETVYLVDGVKKPYDMEKLYRMYHYLESRGEVYFIEIKPAGSSDYLPIGDVSFWQQDMPIVIGDQRFRGMGIGKKVVQALIERARQLEFPWLEVAEIYDYNTGSQRLFESVGFQKVRATEKGHSYRFSCTGKVHCIKDRGKLVNL